MHGTSMRENRCENVRFTRVASCDRIGVGDKFELTELFERGMTIERKFNCMGARKKLEVVKLMNRVFYQLIKVIASDVGV